MREEEIEVVGGELRDVERVRVAVASRDRAEDGAAAGPAHRADASDPTRVFVS